jgi:hypothetical protein
MLNVNDIISTDDYLSFCNDNDICYIKTDFFYIGQFNWRGNLHPIKVDDVCVIGHSDYPITDDIANRFKKVFCINRDTDSENVFGLPLGITNYCDDSDLHKIYGDKQIMIDVISQEIEKKNLIYINFNVNTFQERRYIFNLFSGKDWTFTGNIDNTLEGRKKYLQEIKSSKFVICPRGNGIDTHRMWETLYMGSIPIVKYHRAHHLFTDLPILFINDWSEINEDFLNTKYEKIKNNNKYNMEKLKQSYWNNFIKNNIRQ